MLILRKKEEPLLYYSFLVLILIGGGEFFLHQIYLETSYTVNKYCRRKNNSTMNVLNGYLYTAAVIQWS